jgi:hypothetical protein
MFQANTQLVGKIHWLELKSILFGFENLELFMPIDAVAQRQVNFFETIRDSSIPMQGQMKWIV